MAKRRTYFTRSDICPNCKGGNIASGYGEGYNRNKIFCQCLDCGCNWGFKAKDNTTPIER